MKRFARILSISLLLLGTVPATSINFDDPEPPQCDPHDPKCKPPLPPLA